jgi:hypothetical protein
VVNIPVSFRRYRIWISIKILVILTKKFHGFLKPFQKKWWDRNWNRSRPHLLPTHCNITNDADTQSLHKPRTVLHWTTFVQCPHVLTSCLEQTGVQHPHLAARCWPLYLCHTSWSITRFSPGSATLASPVRPPWGASRTITRTQSTGTTSAISEYQLRNNRSLVHSN